MPRAGARTSNVGESFALPPHFDSVAAIEHCGFTTQAAQEMFTRYHRRPDKENSPDSILDSPWSLELGHSEFLGRNKLEPMLSTWKTWQ